MKEILRAPNYCPNFLSVTQSPLLNFKPEIKDNPNLALFSSSFTYNTTTKNRYSHPCVLLRKTHIHNKYKIRKYRYSSLCTRNPIMFLLRMKGGVFFCAVKTCNYLNVESTGFLEILLTCNVLHL